jgi:hypothetical protein
MRAFLAFTLYAPLASFGALAVGERRETWDRPANPAGRIAADADAAVPFGADLLRRERRRDESQSRAAWRTEVSLIASAS